MRKFISSIIVSLVITAPALADDLGELTSRSIQAHAKIASIQTEMDAALGERRAQYQGLLAALDQLKFPAMNASALAEMDKKIATETQTLKQFLKMGTPTESLQFTYSRIMELTMKRNAGSITSESERSEFRSTMQSEFTRVSDEIEQIEKPFKAKIAKVTKSVSKDDAELTNELSQFFIESKGTSLKHANATMHTAFAGFEWYNASGERIAWAHIRFRSQDEIEDADRQEMLNGKFPVRTANDNSLWVWAGNFLITFVPVDENLKDEETLKDAIFDFVKLGALAKINAQPDGPLAEVFE